ncbi:MAG: 50S ribosomal protein L25 [Nitrospinales bacterium]
MSVALAGKIKKEIGKGFNRQLRIQGRTPAVFYSKSENFGLSVVSKEIEKLKDKHGTTVLIDLAIEGDSQKSRTVIFKDIQIHPIKPGLVHVDFQEVDMKVKIKVDVPINFVGRSPGEKMGGIVNHLLNVLHIKCLPGDIPAEIEILMEEIELNQVVHVSDLKVSDKIEIQNQPSDAVVTVAEAKAVVEEKPDEEEEAEGEPAKADAKATPAEGDKEEKAKGKE